MPAFRSTLKPALGGALAIVFFSRHGVHSPVTYPWELFFSLLITAFITLSAWGWGIVPLRLLWPMKNTHRVAEGIIFSLAFGWGILFLGMIVLGFFHAWTPLGIDVLSSIGALIALWKIRAVSAESAVIVSKPPRLWMFIALVTGCISFLLALAPPTYYDSLVYHLALPAAYIRARHWIGWPDLIYSAFPQNMEMLWTLGLLTGRSLVPGLLSWTISMTLAWAVYSYGQRFLDLSSAAAATGFLLIMPAFLLLSSGGYVDLGLAFFMFLSIYSLSLWTQNPDKRFLILAGLYGGWALGIKYTGAIGIALGVLWILISRPSQQAWKQRVMASALFSVTGILTFLPWLIKNSHYTGNPVFPFFYAWGNQALNPWMQGGAQGYFRGLVEYAPHSLLEFPHLLWRLMTDGLHFGGGSDVLGDFGWTPLFFLLPMVGFIRSKSALVRPLLFYALLFFVSWGMSRPVLRFLLPLAPALAVLAGYGWAQGVKELPRIFALCFRTGILLLVLFNTVVFFQLASVSQPFRVSMGLETKDHYLKRKLTYYGAASYINQQTASDSSVLVVGDQRSYYYERPVAIWTVFNQNPIVRWANQAPTVEALRDTLRHQASLLLVNRAEMKRLMPYHALDFSSQGMQNWDRLLKGLPPLYHDDFCDVYAL